MGLRGNKPKWGWRIQVSPSSPCTSSTKSHMSIHVGTALAPCHICTGTDWANPAHNRQGTTHIYNGNRLTPRNICKGTGSPICTRTGSPLPRIWTGTDLGAPPVAHADEGLAGLTPCCPLRGARRRLRALPRSRRSPTRGSSCTCRHERCNRLKRMGRAYRMQQATCEMQHRMCCKPSGRCNMQQCRMQRAQCKEGQPCERAACRMWSCARARACMNAILSVCVCVCA